MIFVALAAGIKREGIVKGKFWDVFGLKGSENVPEDAMDAALQGKEFTLTSLEIREGVPVEPISSAASSIERPHLYTMGFRCALHVTACVPSCCLL